MRSKKIVALILVLSGFLVASSAIAQEEGGGPEKFSAMAYLPNGAGMRGIGAGRTFNVDIYIESYSSDEQAKLLEDALLEEGGDAVLKTLQKMKSIGKITISGRVGFYDLKFIRSRPGENGRRIVAVTDRPISGLEIFYAGRSQDYTFGVMEIELKPDKKGKREEGEGTLVYAAKIKLIKGNTVEIENYGISPVKLMGVRTR